MIGLFRKEKFEITKENIINLKKREDIESSEWCNYVLSCDWNEEENCIEFYMNGPWEC